MVEAVPKWIEKFLMPGFQEIKGEIKALYTKIDAVEKITEERFLRFEGKMDEKFKQVYKRFEQVDKRFEQVDERFQQIEARLDKDIPRAEDVWRLKFEVEHLKKQLDAS